MSHRSTSMLHNQNRHETSNVTLYKSHKTLNVTKQYVTKLKPSQNKNHHKTYNNELQKLCYFLKKLCILTFKREICYFRLTEQ